MNRDNLRMGVSDSAGLMTYAEAIARLDALGQVRGRPTSTGWTYQCPVHHDTEPSFSVSEVDGELLMNCWGCHASFEEFTAALREVDVDPDDYDSTPRARPKPRPSWMPSPSKLNDWRNNLQWTRNGWPIAVQNAEQYRKTDPYVLQQLDVGLHKREGMDCLVFEIYEPSESGTSAELIGIESVDPRPSKMVKEDAIAKMSAREKDGKVVSKRSYGRRGLYPSPAVASAVCSLRDSETDGYIVLCEGAIDAVSLISLGIPAVGYPSASIWRDEWASRFEGFEQVIVLGDSDTAGRNAITKVATSLARHIDGEVLTVDLEGEDKFDIGDAIADGMTKAEVEELIETAEPFEHQNTKEDPSSEDTHDAQTLKVAAKELVRMRAHDIASEHRQQERMEELLQQVGNPLALLSEIEREEQRFLWKPRIPYGTVTALFGASHVGKSSLGALIAAGHMCGKWSGEPGYVIHIGDEDSSIRVAERMEWLDADLSRYAYWRLDEIGITFPAGVPLLERVIMQDYADKPLMIIIDTATEYLDPGLAINDHQDVTKAVKALRQMAEKLGVVILSVVHTNRTKSSNPQDLTGSSKAWYDRAKSTLFLGPDPDDKLGTRHVFHDKASYSATGPAPPLELGVIRKTLETGETQFKLEINGESDREFREVFDPQEAKKPTKTEMAEQFLDQYFQDRAEAAPFLESEVHKAFAEAYPAGEKDSPSLRTLERARDAKGWRIVTHKGERYVGPAQSILKLKQGKIVK